MDDLISNLIRFKDKAFCSYTYNEADKIFRDIIHQIPKQFGYQIQTEWQHVKLGHGTLQARMALDTEVKKCIEFLTK